MSQDSKDRKTQETGWQGPDHAAPYPLSRLAPPVSLVDMAREIEEADRHINTRVTAKLNVIAEQISALQDRARQVLTEARLDQRLHRAGCSFKKVPGRVYYLYRKETGKSYFSLLAPEEWRGRPPHEYCGAYRLENDLSWSMVTDSDEVSRGLP